ncbi:MAG: hypothetical protein MJ193_01490 [Clostridia bacterium]|nr:hypothetical protein [Clostridia bacterium]
MKKNLLLPLWLLAAVVLAQSCGGRPSLNYKSKNGYDRVAEFYPYTEKNVALMTVAGLAGADVNKVSRSEITSGDYFNTDALNKFAKRHGKNKKYVWLLISDGDGDPTAVYTIDD